MQYKLSIRIILLTVGTCAVTLMICCKNSPKEDIVCRLVASNAAYVRDLGEYEIRAKLKVSSSNGVSIYPYKDSVFQIYPLTPGIRLVPRVQLRPIPPGSPELQPVKLDSNPKIIQVELSNCYVIKSTSSDTGILSKIELRLRYAARGHISNYVLISSRVE